MKDCIEIQIVDSMLTDIIGGKYKMEDKLPSENEVADYYHVPRIHARKAYEKLEQMGYIYSIQGKGRYLLGKREPIELYLSGEESFSEKMQSRGYQLVSRNVFARKIPFHTRIYRELNIEDNDEVYEIGRLRIIDGIPMALHVSYVAKSIMSDIEESGKTILSIFDYYRSKGYDSFNSDKSMLSIAFPTPVQRELFACSDLIPILVLESNCYDQKTKKILEYTKIYYRTDCFKYIITRA